ALRTFTPSRITSGPVPSPARRTILRAIAAAMLSLRLKVSPGSRGPLRRELLLQLLHEPARLQDLEDVWRERFEPHHRPVLETDLSAGHVEVHDLTRLYLRLQPLALEDREP